MAVQSFARLIAFKASRGQCYATLAQNFPAAEVPTKNDQTVVEIRTRANKLLSSTGINFRMPNVPPTRTPEFLDALRCYRGYFDVDGIFVAQDNFYLQPHELVGIPGNGIHDADQAAAQMANVHRLETAILTALAGLKIDFSDCVSRDDIMRKLLFVVAGRNQFAGIQVEVRHGLLQRMEARFIHGSEAENTMQLLKTRVDHHIALRNQSASVFDLVLDDVLSELALHLEPTSAQNLMLVAKRFAENDELRERRPHWHLREVVKTFPHQQTISRDRADLAAGVDKPVMRNFVLGDRPVRLYIDYACLSRREVPLRKKERADGLSNRERDLDDDEYETPPEIAGRAPPIDDVQDDPNTQWGAEALRTKKRKKAEWRLLEGPYEKVHKEHFFQRLDFPPALVTMTPSLVFADTKQPVPCKVHTGGLRLSPAMLRREGTFSQGYMPDATLLPASCKVTVPLMHSSRNHSGRLFCIKIAIENTQGCTTTLYSKPFEVVSKLSVVTNARKRKLAAPPPDRKKKKAN